MLRKRSNAHVNLEAARAIGRDITMLEYFEYLSCLDWRTFRFLKQDLRIRTTFLKGCKCLALECHDMMRIILKETLRKLLAQEQK